MGKDFYFLIFAEMRKGIFLIGSCVFGVVVWGCWEVNINTQQVQQIAESGFNTVSESTKEFLKTNEYAQKVQEIGNQAIETTVNKANERSAKVKDNAQQLGHQAVEGATNFLSWARHEVETQYQNMKQQAKDSVKNDLNARVNKVFESF